MATTGDTSKKEIQILGNLFTECTNYIDQHINEFRYAVYGLAFVGTAITVRSLRVFGRFRRAEKIPKEYFRKNVKLHGIVRNVNSETGALLVEHIPILQVFRHKSTDQLLPVALSGVKLGPMGSQWVNTTTKNDKIEFVLLAINPRKEVESIVTLSEGFLKKRCLNLEVVRLGMGQVASQSTDLKKNKHYRKLYVDLLAFEADAVQNHRGIWFSSGNQQTGKTKRSLPLFNVSTVSWMYRTVWDKFVNMVKLSLKKKTII